MILSATPKYDHSYVLSLRRFSKDLDGINKLNGLSSNDFDKEYMSQMVKDHSKTLSAFMSEAKDTQDMKFKNALLQGKTAVAAHKNMAYDLKEKL